MTVITIDIAVPTALNTHVIHLATFVILSNIIAPFPRVLPQTPELDDTFTGCADHDIIVTVYV